MSSPTPSGLAISKMSAKYELLILDFVGVCTAPLADLAQTADHTNPAVPVHQWAEPVIRDAQATGVVVVVLSNDLPESTIKATPLLTAIDATISLADSAITKPDRRAFERVMLTHQISANRTLIVDDSLENIHGAQSTGATTLHFDPSTPHHSWKAVQTELGL